MIKIRLVAIALFGSISFLFSQEISVDCFLENYFETKNYNIERYSLQGKEVQFAYRTLDKDHKVFNKGLMFQMENKRSIRPLVYFLNMSIFSSSDLLFTGKIQTQKFWGWSVRIVEDSNSFATTFYTNNGTHVTEGPIFIWDNIAKSYKQYLIDKSML